MEHRRVRVTGLYQYTNHSALPAVLTLGIPFPVDAEHPAPEWFLLAEATDEGGVIRELLPYGDARDLRVRLLFAPRESKWLRLDYEQKAHASNGRYLLTTTRAWRRPIARAEFTLRLAAPLELAESNYALQPVPSTRDRKVYGFRAVDFYPHRDWEFAWREARAAAPPTGGSP